MLRACVWVVELMVGNCGKFVRFFTVQKLKNLIVGKPDDLSTVFTLVFHPLFHPQKLVFIPVNDCVLPIINKFNKYNDKFKLTFNYYRRMSA
jgi:hypothetical protein